MNHTLEVIAISAGAIAGWEAGKWWLGSVALPWLRGRGNSGV